MDRSRLSEADATEEVLVEMSPQELIKLKGWRKLVVMVRNALRDFGFDNLADQLDAWLSKDLTEQEKADLFVADLVRAARRWVVGYNPDGQESSAVTVLSRLSRQDQAAPDTGGAKSVREATILGDLGSLNSDLDYMAGKSGDVEAALRTAQRVVTEDAVSMVKGIDKPIVLGVLSVEATGRNKIPGAAARVIASLAGAQRDVDIVQSNSPQRTSMDGLGRIFNRPKFDGKVKRGRNYVLVDDTITQGGTFAALANHIEAGGGKVAGIIALSGKKYSAKISADADAINAVRQKYGDLENEFIKATGYGFDQLTQSEARYLANFKPAIEVRSRILEAGSKGRRSSDAGNSGQTGQNSSNLKPKQTDTPAFKRWFGNSKVVDAEGRPLVVYHGTNADFNVFDSTLGFTPGSWLTSNQLSASVFGKQMAVYLAIDNPASLADLAKARRLAAQRFDVMNQHKKFNEAVIVELEQQGFDGIHDIT